MPQPSSRPLPDSPFASFSLHAASSSDAQALATLLQQLGSDEPRADPTLLALRLNELPHSHEVLVAERDGKLLGTCTLNLIEHLAHNFAGSGVVEDVVVDADARGLGIGRAGDCYKLALSSSQSREAAHRFYQQLGFTPYGISLALTLD